MPHLLPKQIERARQIDLLSYLRQYEPQELVRCGGNEYSTKSHDSLKISNGKWFWWSRGIGGASALDYLVKVRGMQFVEAVNLLAGGTVEIPPFSSPQAPKKYDRLYMARHNFVCKKVREYLVGRGISAEIVDECIAKKTIAEGNKYGSVFFIGYDEKGKPRHCAMRATDGSDFKKDAAGSDKRYCFSFPGRKESKRVMVFESAIDLLSYATLLKDMGVDYRQIPMISLAGIALLKEKNEELKVPQALEYYLETHNEVKQICLCLDNDFAGRRGANTLQKMLGEIYEVRYIPPQKGKDYNEYLQKKKENVYENNRKNKAREKQ